MPERGEQETADLVAHLGVDGERQVWRECLNGRFLVFLNYAGRTYCLLPLSYGGPEDGRE